MLEKELRELGKERAPRTLLPAVMSAIAPEDECFHVDAEIGRFYVAHNTLGVSAVTRCESLAEFEKYVLRDRGRRVRETPAPAALKAQVQDWLAGRPVRIRFDLRGLTDFGRAVLLKAVEIPRGEIRSYGWVAREIGRPLAVRAVGTALANNPIPLFIPCHRVVRSDGRIGQYGMGGPETKRRLLLWEGVPADRLGPALAS